MRHLGGGASARLDGVYVLGAQRHSDQTTQVVHELVDGVTTQLTKGVVTDQARGVFQGRIVVAKGADRTDARMGHHALILSDRAEIDAKRSWRSMPTTSPAPTAIRLGRWTRRPCSTPSRAASRRTSAGPC